MGYETTIHGFRASFRTWAAESTAFPREIIEAALAHVIGDKTEQAYQRSDLVEKRRQLMEAWEHVRCITTGGQGRQRPANAQGRRCDMANKIVAYQTQLWPNRPITPL